MARKTRSTEDYDTMTHIEHVLKVPDTYIGSTNISPKLEKNLYDFETKLVLVNQPIDYCEGMERLYLEVFSNAVDNIISTWHLKGAESTKNLINCRTPPVTITISDDFKTIKIKNLGEPIPVAPKTADEGNEKKLVLVPDIIFSQLLSSSNYSAKDTRVGAGRNGYGAKLTNIYSKRFKVKIADYSSNAAGGGQVYTCEWVNNMNSVKSRTVKPGFEFSKDQKKWVPKKAEKEAKTSSKTKKESYVEIEFELDFERFKYAASETGDTVTDDVPRQHSLECYSKEIIGVFARIALDYSFTCKIPIKFNDTIFDARIPKTFVKYYYPTDTTAIVHYEWANPEDEAKFKSLSGTAVAKALISDVVVPVVELIVLDTPSDNGGGKIFGFVNGICVPEGVHVYEAFTKVSASLLAAIGQIKAFSNGGAVTSTGDIRNHISLIVNCHLPNPKFTSQTKQSLASPRPRITISPDVFKNALTTSSGQKWTGLATHLTHVVEFKLKKSISKSDVKNHKRVTNIEGASEANFAGTNKSEQCTLWLTEGDSAAAYTEKRIDLLPGKKDFHGVYGCRGKFINVRSSGSQLLAKNKEYCELKTLFGLAEDMDYTNPEVAAKKLKYGRIIIAADADEDGSSIRALLLNCFITRWPSLIHTGRIAYLATPAIRVFNKQTGAIVERFYSDTNYYKWEKLQTKEFLAKLKIKHLKGLASSSDKDILDDLTTAPTVHIVYDDRADEAMDLAFSTKRADDRKKWIEDWRKNGAIGQDDDVVLEAVSKTFNSKQETTSSTVTKKTKTAIAAIASLPVSNRTISAIINKDLAEYSFGSLFRAISNFSDGLKRSQRQAIWHCLNYWNYGDNKNDSLKISRLASAVAEATNYAHGEASMQGTLISLAQDFTGSNNVAILYPDGQFGSRKGGPTVHGAARYINTRLSDLAPFMFSRDIVELVNRRSVEGELVESEWIPCDIPLAVVNGVRGIATGWSSFIPSHNPIEVIDWIVSKIKGEKYTKSIMPFFCGYKGVLRVDESDGEGSNSTNSVISEGLFKVIREPTPANPTYDVEVTELPIGTWMKGYEKWLNSLIEANRLSNFRDKSDSKNVHFVLTNFSAVENTAAKACAVDTKKASADAFTAVAPISRKLLKLSKSMPLSNMVLIDNLGVPKRYEKVEGILEDYFQVMQDIYAKYKISSMNKLKEQIRILTEKEKILTAIVNNKLVVFKRLEKDILNDIKTQNLSAEEYEKLKIKDCTQEKIMETLNKIKTLNGELRIIEETASNEMWKRRLVVLRGKLNC